MRKGGVNFSQHISGLRDVKKWECLNADTGEDSAFIRFRHDMLSKKVRKYHLPDFSNWKNHAAFERALARPFLGTLHRLLVQ